MATDCAAISGPSRGPSHWAAPRRTRAWRPARPASRRATTRSRRQAGRQGGAPVGNNNAEKQAKTSKNKQNGINDNDNDNDNDIIPPITPRVGFETFGSFGNVFLKPAELRKLQMDYTPEAVSKAIEDLSCKLADGSQQSDNHCATLRYWLSFRRTADTSPKGKMEAADEIKRQTEQILGLQ